MEWFGAVASFNEIPRDEKDEEYKDKDDTDDVYDIELRLQNIYEYMNIPPVSSGGAVGIARRVYHASVFNISFNFVEV